MESSDEEDGGFAPGNLTLSTYLDQKEVPKTNNLSILSLNVRSMNNKFQKIREITTDVSADILCIQETWGKNKITDYSIVGYHKPEINVRGETMNLGGGVGIWVKETIDYIVIKSPFTSKQIETQTVLLQSLNTYLINVYRPFGDKHAFVATLTNHISTLRGQGKNIIVVGDFNLDLASPDDDVDYLTDMMTNSGFIQQVTLTTRQTSSSNTIIDHVYTDCKTNSMSDVIVTDISDHYATYTTLQGKIKTKDEIKCTKRWFKVDDYIKLKELLSVEDWSCMNSMSLDRATNHLTERIIAAMDLVAPIESKSFSKKENVPWLTKGIRVSLENSRSFYKQSHKSDCDREIYKNYKKILDRVIRTSKKNHYNNKVKGAGKDSRKIWSILNEVIDRKQCKHKMPTNFDINGETISDKQMIAKAFNNYFASIGTDMAGQIAKEDGYEEYLKRWTVHIPIAELAEEQVELIMKNQQPKLSCGVDNINNKIVKLCHKELAEPMTMIINLSIRTGRVPLAYKRARIIPLYKKGPPNQCGNYRPVSLLPALSKILEKAVASQLVRNLDESNLLCSSQYGFRPKNQTNHVVQNMMNFITEKVVQKEVVIATFIDLSKAFDCLQYDKLFTKLEKLGVRDTELEWFKDYLTDRQQLVEIEGTQSEWQGVQLGVPQGSILGPILFLIYVNDINNCNRDAKFTKFADDTTVLTSGKTLLEAVDKMNAAMVDIAKWFRRNKLNLNPSKTRYMIFNHLTTETDLVRIDNEYLQRVWEGGKEKSFKLVGIEIDEKLKWDRHIDNVAKKMNYANYALGKASKELDVKTKKLTYSGLIHSHLVYGLPFWGFATKGRLQKLLVKQKQSIRKIYNLKYRDHTLEFFAKGNILQLPELVEYTALTYIHSGISKKSPYNVQQLWTIRERHRDNMRDTGSLLEYPRSSLQWVNNLPTVAQAKLWNNCKLVKDVKPSIFKLDCKKAYLNRYPSSISDPQQQL